MNEQNASPTFPDSLNKTHWLETAECLWCSYLQGGIVPTPNFDVLKRKGRVKKDQQQLWCNPLGKILSKILKTNLSICPC